MVFKVSYIDCTLSNYVSVLKSSMSVMVVYQPAFVLLPVSMTGPWYSEKKLTNIGRSVSGFKQKQEGCGSDYCWYTSFDYINSYHHCFDARS